MKLFSTQLVAKSRIPSDELESSGCDLYPSLQLWLKVVGLSPAAVQVSHAAAARPFSPTSLTCGYPRVSACVRHRS